MAKMTIRLIALFLLGKLSLHPLFAGSPPSSWVKSTVDSVDEGLYIHPSYTSITIDQEGFAHVSYRGPGRDLRYATNRYGGWQTEILLDTSAPVARESSITVDRYGHPSISFSYRDGNGEDLYLATRSVAGHWAISSIYSTHSAGMESDIATDAAGQRHLSHFEWLGSELLYSTTHDGEWVLGRWRLEPLSIRWIREPARYPWALQLGRLRRQL